MTTLPEPSFIQRDTAAITAEMVAAYEAATGKTLLPAQVERVLVDTIAYRETLTRIAIQEAAKQNLPSYARAPMLDYLGQLTGAQRLPAQAARVLIEFTWAGDETAAIPTGTLVQSPDGALRFATSVDAYIPAGTGSVQVWADAMTPGAALNGIATGQLSALPDPPCTGMTAVNISVSYGGADAETDDKFRERVMLAPERAACGTPAAYRLAALSTHQDLLDVAVTSESPGCVTVSAATATGSPDEGLLDLLRTRLQGEDIKPLTDRVTVIAPERVPFAIDLTLTLYPRASGVAGAVRTTLEQYAALLRKTLGADLTPSKFIALAQNVAGVQAVTLVSPALTELTAHQYADCTSIQVVVSGVSDD